MSIEAMKQALEALIQIRTPLRVNTSLDAYDVGRAITSLRQAIAEAENQYAAKTAELAYLRGRTQIDLNTGNISIVSKETIAEAEKQEPFGEAIAHGVVRWNVAYPSVGTKLYTHPQPKREWVGLTVKEANELWESTDSDWELMKRVEAKLKDKNGF